MVRPQDSAKKASGKIKFEGMMMYGTDGTKFSMIKKSDKIRPGRMSEFFKIKEVLKKIFSIKSSFYMRTGHLRHRGHSARGKGGALTITSHADPGSVDRVRGDRIYRSIARV